MLLQLFSLILSIGVALGRKRLGKIVRELPRSMIMLPFLVGTQVFYLFAFRFAPADQVDLINYLWPIMTVIGSSLLFAERLTTFSIIGMALGFLAILFLGRVEIFSGGYDPEFFMGYAFAFGAALSWTVYTLIGRSIKGIDASQHIGIHLGLSGLVVALFHTAYGGPFVPMGLWEWAVIAVLGCLVYGVAYPLWWYGIEYGEFALVTSFSYFSPILSILLLVANGIVELTLDLAIACTMVAAGSWLVNRSSGVRQSDQNEEPIGSESLKT